MSVGFRCFSVTLGILCCLSNCAAYCQVEVLTKKAGSDVLTILKPAPAEETLGFCLVPPDKNDRKAELSIAAAFTTKSASISGVTICNGKKIVGAVNTHLGGTAIFINGNFDVFSNEHGKVLTPDFIAAVQQSGGSLFQQFLLVKDSTAQSFKDTGLAPRRALVVFNNGDRGVVQSVKTMTLAQFARDMQSVGVRNAVYTPVGDADGGWYRNGDKIVSIGVPSSPTPVQSNWVVWMKTASKQAAPTVEKWMQEHNHVSPSK